jgi:hypothetical protein
LYILSTTKDTKNTKEEKKMLKHVVFIKFKEGITDTEIATLEKALGGLPAKIPEIKGFQFGRDIVRSERSYDFSLVSDFDNLEAMKRYQLHPDHVPVIAMVRSVSANILAVDFEY